MCREGGRGLYQSRKKLLLTWTNCKYLMQNYQNSKHPFHLNEPLIFLLLGSFFLSIPSSLLSIYLLHWSPLVFPLTTPYNPESRGSRIIGMLRNRGWAKWVMGNMAVGVWVGGYWMGGKKVWSGLVRNFGGLVKWVFLSFICGADFASTILSLTTANPIYFLL